MWKTLMFTLYIEVIQKNRRKKWKCVYVDIRMWKVRRISVKKYVEK